jgi:endonuclease/exonuclease/phosphatase (EEP) superfamily protein YafD
VLAEAMIAGQPVRIAGGVAPKEIADPAAAEAFRQRLAEAGRAAPGFLPGVDLNAGPDIPGVRRLRGALGDAFAAAGFGFGATFPAPGRRSGMFGAFLRLDLVLHDAAFVPLRAEVLADFAGSTHYPVRVEFAFPGQGRDGAPCG